MTADQGSELVTIEEIRGASIVLAAIARRTPVERPLGLSQLVGHPLVMKCEQLQRTGSFKLRGAYHHLAAQDPRPDAVVAASAGNHAQGVALAATTLGIRSTIFMPESAALPKVAATRAYGADVKLIGAAFDEAAAAATEYAHRSGAAFVPAFDDPLVIAGQGTVGLEFADQAPDVETFVVSIGGGGLVSGVAAALKALRPSCRVIGVQADGAASMRAALHAGHPTPLDHLDTIADGIAVREVSARTLAHVVAFVDEVVTVTDDQIALAVVLLLERAKTLVEPAGAAPLAAVLAGHVPAPDGAPIGLVLSGGNVDPSLLIRLVRHGLTAGGRYLVVRVVLDDRPGALHGLLGMIATLGLNVVDVEHHRTGIALPVDEVEVRLALETRDPAHRDDALRALAAAGYRMIPA